MTVWLILIFVLGACIGSFINVCVYRLPLQKSLLWPSSRCGRCAQPIRWYDNVPLVSYWLLRGRCRTCRATFSVRYFLVELFTALMFVGLFYLDVIENDSDYDVRLLGVERYDVAVLATFGMHAVLASFLLTASLCDYDHREIPLPLTLSGTVVGLIAAMLFPWPWPYDLGEVQLPPVLWWLVAPEAIPEGVYRWPIAGPPPAWLFPGSPFGGLLTGLAGVLAGTLLLRVIRFLFGLGMGSRYNDPPAPEEAGYGLPRRAWSWAGRVGGQALGIGDADLMMMAGAFLGWQATIVAFFVSVFPGLIAAVNQKRRGDDKLPFGPSLAMGVMMTVYLWWWLGPRVQALFFNGRLLALVVISGSVLMLIAGFIVGYFKRVSD